MEVERLVLLRALKRANDSEWGVPYFAQPKPNTNQVHFLGNFRNLNKQLKHNHIQCLRSMKYYLNKNFSVCYTT